MLLYHCQSMEGKGTQASQLFGNVFKSRRHLRGKEVASSLQLWRSQPQAPALKGSGRGCEPQPPSAGEGTNPGCTWPSCVTRVQIPQTRTSQGAIPEKQAVVSFLSDCGFFNCTDFKIKFIMTLSSGSLVGALGAAQLWFQNKKKLSQEEPHRSLFQFPP